MCNLLCLSEADMRSRHLPTELEKFKARPRTNEIVVSQYFLFVRVLHATQGFPIYTSQISHLLQSLTLASSSGLRSQFLPVFPLQPPFEISTGQ